MATAPEDLVFKFDTTTDASQLFTLTSGTLAEGETGIRFNLQIMEKFGGAARIGDDHIGSTVVGTGPQKINKETARDLANLITCYLSDKSILESLALSEGNISSMKLIVNVDPTA